MSLHLNDFSLYQVRIKVKIHQSPFYLVKFIGNDSGWGTLINERFFLPWWLTFPPDGMEWWNRKMWFVSWRHKEGSPFLFRVMPWNHRVVVWMVREVLLLHYFFIWVIRGGQSFYRDRIRNLWSWDRNRIWILFLISRPKLWSLKEIKIQVSYFKIWTWIEIDEIIDLGHIFLFLKISRLNGNITVGPSPSSPPPLS